MIKKLVSIVLLAGVMMSLTACSGSSESQSTKESNGKIVVGSKSFTEGNILSELYALALEHNGFEVERKFNIAGSVIHQAILSEEIDVYPEYTGTALLSILKQPVMTDEKEVYDFVKQNYEEQFDLTWLEPSPMNDGQGLVLRTEVAEQYNIQTISDLQKNADKIRFASQGDFDERDDGIPALERVYGPFNFASSVVFEDSLKYDVLRADKIRFASQGDFDERDDGIPALERVYGPFNFASSVVFEDSLKYDVLRNNEADLAVAYTTEGMLRDEAFTLLEDDGKVWPPYNAAPVIRKPVLEQNPKAELVLNQLSSLLTTEKITELNAQVDIDKLEMEEVAANFFNEIKDQVTIE